MPVPEVCSEVCLKVFALRGWGEGLRWVLVKPRRDGRLRLGLKERGNRNPWKQTFDPTQTLIHTSVFQCVEEGLTAELARGSSSALLLLFLPKDGDSVTDAEPTPAVSSSDTHNLSVKLI